VRFRNDVPVFIQIADAFAARIAAGELRDGERLPSARDLASELEVNPATAARALQRLADEGLAATERTCGYRVSAGARQAALSSRRERLLGQTLASVAAEARVLGISRTELCRGLARAFAEPPEEPAD